MVPFSVQHTYEGKYEKAPQELTSCSPGSMKFVTNKEEKQEVAEGKEVIFTYDVLFLVSLLCAAQHNRQPCSGCTAKVLGQTRQTPRKMRAACCIARPGLPT